MTDHPCKGMTKPQRDAFEQIAIGLFPVARPKTIKALLDAGVIEQLPDKIIGHDGFGCITRPDYCVPLLIHMDWCKWASEQPENADTAD